MTPIISPAISPLEMADWEEATLTAGEDERVVTEGEDGEVGGGGGGEDGVVLGGEDVVCDVVGGASVVVVVMVTAAQSGAERLSNAAEHVGSM